MATPIQMPKVGISVESCILTKWHKKVGDKVKKGEVLFTYETDKTTVDEEASEDGTLLGIFFEEGDDVPVMQYVGALGNPGEEFAQFAPKKEEEPAPAPAAPEAVAAPATAAPQAVPAAPATVDGDRLKISPRARVAAQKTGVDPKFAKATGAEGRITERDIMALASSATGAMAGSATGEGGTGIGGRLSAHDAVSVSATSEAPKAEYYDEKISNVRKVIAKTMHESISTMAQLTHNASFDATNILEFRKLLKEKGESLGLPNITINDIILFTVARILPKHKYLNAHFLGDSMRFFTSANVGIAVDTEKGLLVPTLFGAEKLSLSEVARRAKDLAKQAQSGNISPDLLKGGSFTVSNLGSLGIESFTPIINPPQTAILGVNTIKDAIRVVDGEIKPYKSMSLSLTYDHRAVDGAPASKFLRDVCVALENFTLTMAI